MRTFPKHISGITFALVSMIGLSLVNISSQESVAHRGSGRLNDGPSTLAYRGSGRLQPDPELLTYDIETVRIITHRGSGRIQTV